MDPTRAGSNLIRILLFCILISFLRFAYVITTTQGGGSCDSAADFCFFSAPVAPKLRRTFVDRLNRVSAVSAGDNGGGGSASIHDLWTSKAWRKSVDYYSKNFENLIADGYLSSQSKALCIETVVGEEVFALREIGVFDAIGISKKESPPFVVAGEAFRQPFHDNTFDFEFSGDGVIDRSVRPADLASEIVRTLKPGGFLVVHTAAKDVYAFNSFLDLFNCCKLITFSDIDGIDTGKLKIRQIVLKKMEDNTQNLNSGDECFVPEFERDLVSNAEPLIAVEPLKPWITLKKNINNIKYLPSMVDISFKHRYVYIDVGSRNYGSSIVSWFKKQYPKQSKNFDIYAIEADKAFHDEYRGKKGVTLLPYAAWVRNETLFFEINREPNQKNEGKGRGMGRIHTVQSSAKFVGDVDNIQGFDFADWLKNMVTKRDFVVVKMDVEGAEFHLIPKLIESGAICLIDEIFLECHYNRWQRCCPGKRSPKYRKTYAQCLNLFSSLRENGVLVHQWW